MAAHGGHTQFLKLAQNIFLFSITGMESKYFWHVC
jgi:hypothetical protein